MYLYDSKYPMYELYDDINMYCTTSLSWFTYLLSFSLLYIIRTNIMDSKNFDLTIIVYHILTRGLWLLTNNHTHTHKRYFGPRSNKIEKINASFNSNSNFFLITKHFKLFLYNQINFTYHQTGLIK